MIDKLILKGLPKGYYTEDSTIYVNEDQLQSALDIKPEKIVKGQSIAGVSGLAVVNGVDTSDADATASDILAPKTAYVNGEKITGNIVNQPPETAGLGWDFLTETINPGDSPSYGRAMFVAIPKGAYVGEFTNQNWEGPAGPVVRIPSKTQTITPNEYEQTISTTTKVIEKITVNPIPSSYKNTSDATATANDILSEATAYVDGNKITGIMPSLTDNTNINLTSSNSTKVIPCSHAYYRTNTDGVDRLCFLYQGDNGYIQGNGATLFAADTSLISASETAGGLIASNILSGKSVFGLNGTATNDANATPNELLENHAAYVKGEKIIGTIPNMNIVDPTIGGINADYPGVAVHKGTAGQFGTTATSNELLFAVAPQKGYYSGQSYVGYPAKDVSVTPSTTSQSIYPDYGEVLRSVTVNPIPSNYWNIKYVNEEITINEPKEKAIFDLKKHGFIANNSIFYHVYIFFELYSPWTNNNGLMFTGEGGGESPYMVDGLSFYVNDDQYNVESNKFELSLNGFTNEIPSKCTVFPLTITLIYGIVK